MRYFVWKSPQGPNRCPSETYSVQESCTSDRASCINRRLVDKFAYSPEENFTTCQHLNFQWQSSSFRSRCEHVDKSWIIITSPGMCRLLYGRARLIVEGIKRNGSQERAREVVWPPCIPAGSILPLLECAFVGTAGWDPVLEAEGKERWCLWMVSFLAWPA